MQNNDLIKAINNLQPHDHLCLIYETQDEQFEAAIPYIYEGLKKGEKCIYIADENTVESVQTAMNETGIDVESHQKSGALSIVTSQESYLKEGSFDPDRMIQFLKNLTKEAKEEGYSALRVTGEMTWVLAGDPGSDRVMEYEAKLNYFIDKNDCLAICQYNRNKFSPDTILDVIHTHPMVIYGRTVANNFYYIPPDEFLQSGQASLGVERFLNNIVEREKAERALQKSEEKYRRLFSSIRDAILVADKERKIIACNPAFTDLLGYELEEIKGKPTEYVYHEPEQFEKMGQKIKERMDKGNFFYTIDYEKKSGAVFPGETNVFYLKDNEGNTTGFIGLIRDISERRRAKEKIEHLNSLLRSVRNVNQIIAKQENLTEMMQKTCDSLIETRSYLGSSVSLINDKNERIKPFVSSGEPEFDKGWSVTQKGQGRAPKCIKKTVKSGNMQILNPSECGKCSFIKQSKEHLCILVPMKRGNEVIGILQVGLEKDSEIGKKEKNLLIEIAGDMAFGWGKIRAEKKLRESEERYRRLFETAQDGMLILDATTGKIIDANPFIQDILGYKVNELVGKQLWEIGTFRDVVENQAKLQELQTQGYVRYESLPLKSKSGKEVPVEFVSNTYQAGDKKVIQCNIRDIAERRKAEIELQKSEKKYHNLFETMEQGVVYQNAKGEITSANPAAQRILGLSLDQMQGRTSTDPRWKAVDKDKNELPGEKHPAMIALREGKPVNDFLQGIFNPEKEEYVWILVNAIPQFKEGSEEPFQVYSTFLDITERKKAEEELQESENKFRRYIENAPDGIFVADDNGNYLEVNNAASEITGYSKEELLEMSISDILQPAEIQKGMNHFKKVQEIGSAQGEFGFVTKSGENRFWYVAAVKLSKTRFLGFVKDITKRKKAEEELLESKREISTLLSNLPGMAYRCRNDTQWTMEFVSKGGLELTGYEPEEIIGNNDISYREIIHPDDRKMVWDKVQEAVKGEQHYELEYRIITKENKEKWVSERGLCVASDDSDSEVLEGFISDITEQKKAEQELRKSEEKYKELINGMGDTAWVIDFDGNFMDVNNAAVEILGYTREELLSMSPLDIDNNLDPEDITDLVKEMPSDKMQVFETVHTTKDGKKIPMEIKSSLVNYQGKHAILSVARDITERKEAEEQLHKSNRMWNDTFEAISDIVCVISREHEFLKINTAGCRALGLPREEIIGKKCYELVHETDSPITQCPCENVLKTKEPATNEYEEKGRFYELGAWPIDGPDGELVSFTHIIRDITERKEAEEALKESEQKYHNLIQQSNDAIYLLYKSKFELINNRFEELFGITQEQANDPDFNFMQLVAPESRAEVKQRWAEVEAGNETNSQYEFTALDKNDNPIEVEVSVSYVSYKDGIAAQGILRDITRRKELEQLLRQSQKMESIGRLAGGIAHDMNNLLSPILGYSHMLQKSFDEDTRLRRWSNSIYKAGNSAKTLADQLLTFSRKKTINIETLNLNNIIEGFRKLLRKTIREDIEISYELDDRIRPIQADRGQIEQVIMNLVVNAGDALPEGGNIRIETRITDLGQDYKASYGNFEPGKYVVLSISDTGQGMDKETQKKIFEPFFSTKGDQGTGMGLATVYGIVKKHKGDIHVYSEPGQGTTFKIYLPVKKRDTTEEKTEDKKRGSDVCGTETILVAEDNKESLELIKEVLEEKGYTVIIAENGKEALEKADQFDQSIDLLLTDIVMPEINGKELSLEITNRFPEIKLIYMSGYPDGILNKHGLVEDDINFMQKPLDIDKIARNIRKVLDR